MIIVLPPHVAAKKIRKGCMLLKIDLQEGFSEDTVVIQVNNREVFRKRGVTTKMILGLADSIELEVPDLSAIIKVALPSKGLSETISLPLDAPVYLGLSVMNSQIAYIVDQKPFAYF